MVPMWLHPLHPPWFMEGWFVWTGGEGWLKSNKITKSGQNRPKNHHFSIQKLPPRDPCRDATEHLTEALGFFGSPPWLHHNKFLEWFCPACNITCPILERIPCQRRDTWQIVAMKMLIHTEQTPEIRENLGNPKIWKTGALLDSFMPRHSSHADAKCWTNFHCRRTSCGDQSRHTCGAELRSTENKLIFFLDRYKTILAF